MAWAARIEQRKDAGKPNIVGYWADRGHSDATVRSRSPAATAHSPEQCVQARGNWESTISSGPDIRPWAGEAGLRAVRRPQRSVSSFLSLAETRNRQELLVLDAGWTVVLDQILDRSHGTAAKAP